MTSKKHKPPYVPTWILDDFFKKIKLVNVPPVLNAQTLRGWQIAPKQEHFLTSALGFLELVDAHGKPAPNLKKIQVEGEAFKSNLKEVVREAYSDLFKSVDVENANYETLANFFGMNYSQATKDRMVKCFVHLWGLAGMKCPASEELKRKASVSVDKVTQKVRRTIRKSPKGGGPKPGEPEPPPQSNDKLLQVFEIMADWDAEKMKVFFDNFDKVKEMIRGEKKEKTEG